MNSGPQTGQVKEDIIVFMCYHNLRIHYTGSMILGRQFDRTLYQHIGYQTATDFDIEST